MLTQHELKTVLSYDPITGTFTWVRPASVRMKPGDQAGCVEPTGYVGMVVNYQRYRAHRLAWLYVYGVMPEGEIDHMDGDKSNNAITNLRVVTTKQNRENTGLQCNNTSGVRGVYWDKRREKWMARVQHHKKWIFLGRFDSIDQAAQIVKEARRTTFTHNDTTYSN
jgi:hypothetical protein